jgi:hypothetical protein
VPKVTTEDKSTLQRFVTVLAGQTDKQARVMDTKKRKPNVPRPTPRSGRPDTPAARMDLATFSQQHTVKVDPSLNYHLAAGTLVAVTPDCGDADVDPTSRLSGWPSSPATCATATTLIQTSSGLATAWPSWCGPTRGRSLSPPACALTLRPSHAPWRYPAPTWETTTSLWRSSRWRCLRRSHATSRAPTPMRWPVEKGQRCDADIVLLPAAEADSSLAYLKRDARAGRSGGWRRALVP